MAPQPRWTIPINMRSQDKPILDAALEIARRDGSDITTVFRTALAQFVINKSKAEGPRIDEFLDFSEKSDGIYNRILTPAELRSWTVAGVLEAARHVRARQQELDSELRRRGYFFRW